MGGGRKGVLRTDEEKLAYILMYVKVYPTFDVLSVLTNRVRSKCCESVHLLLPVLEKTLGRTISLPKRKIRSIEEFYKICPEAKDVFIDGTERRVQKPKSMKKRNKLYSGKKKSTTRKMIILSDEKRRILLMSPCKSGRRHDKRLVDKIGWVSNIPKHVAIWADTGFKGLQHPNVVMPEKRRRGHPLTDEQKKNNKVISSIRVLAEHAICGIKRLKAASDIYRNRLPNLDDTLSRISAGIWNFHLQQTT